MVSRLFVSTSINDLSFNMANESGTFLDIKQRGVHDGAHDSQMSIASATCKPIIWHAISKNIVFSASDGRPSKLMLNLLKTSGLLCKVSAVLIQTSSFFPNICFPIISKAIGRPSQEHVIRVAKSYIFELEAFEGGFVPLKA